jgi:hypothetical protein
MGVADKMLSKLTPHFEKKKELVTGGTHMDIKATVAKLIVSKPE